MERRGFIASLAGSLAAVVGWFAGRAPVVDTNVTARVLLPSPMPYGVFHTKSCGTLRVGDAVVYNGQGVIAIASSRGGWEYR